MILALAAWAATAHAQILNTNNGHYYKFVAANLTWEQASNAATSQQFLGVNGYLATITDASEQSFILTNFGVNFPAYFSTTPVWLGGFQPPGSQEPAGNWQWVTGEPFVYTNWDSGEPNNNGNEDVVEIRSDGFWNDTADTRVGSGYLVEFAPVPEFSRLDIRISQVELCWWTANNIWYQLQYSSTLTTNQWAPLTGTWVAGDGTRYCTNDAILLGQPQRFYQLAVTNSPPQP